ncbi:UDP-N-acetylmuramoyl-tripeptide--D-alanyl-D-alanine ligase [Spiribacter halobius]|uniref:UDP-N-acetylmuramoyl-tripeptide--D-alanyl-D-alanine ligase n=1 Tax=Sediminicurvatus halobius TaxID=2182432 RepID=A0A2U2N7W0_9GAMM|nr:UDP-N-acetylmuramoyl-tripeptide--D-alanyl-D-alanine ligase [Spiribacter halobius]PWG65178.1 UDP-N-acetylmuramoyl-tripeptide--D-alanyl-D-alanine ligase [Spiribacter halobius]UEX78870.1 UDP-N-acetylmuramoyl-tripeptide--D-alanyl-D-alanine ligase [Spiribacter halobius]
MDPVRLRTLASELGGEVRGEDSEITAAGIDSRRLPPGALFVALPGSRHDGHEFVAAAREAGAAAALVTRFVDDPLPQWCVESAPRTLAELGCRARSRSPALRIGVTGSNGKTTVKGMLAAILAGEGETLATAGNLNNELGVPLTLCRLAAHHRYAVLELGCSRPGDIRLLASWSRPQVGLVNNAAPAHLEGFGSVEAVARTKGELFEALPADGWAIINADDAHAGLWEQQAAHCRVLRFGLASPAADVSGEATADGGLRIALPSGVILVRLALPGRHNRANAVAAAAAAWAAGARPEAIVAGLERVAPVPGRLAPRTGLHGSEILDDSYNANPASLEAALEAAAADDREVWLALGDMAELGDQAEALHAEAGRRARRLGVTRLDACGALAAHAAAAFGDGGYRHPDQGALIAALQAALHPGVRLLVKGSRSAAMERVADALAHDRGREGVPCS